jgi:hypothetical protein
MCVELITFAFTYPWPNPLCGTMVQAFHGLYPPYTPTLKPKTARLFHPSGHQLTYPGAYAHDTHAGPHVTPGIQNQAPAEKPQRP